jgi:translocation and assembly module TamB
LPRRGSRRPIRPGAGGGDRARRSLRMFLQEGANALQISDIRLEGAGLTGTGAIKVEGLEDAFLASGRLTVRPRISRAFRVWRGGNWAGRDAGRQRIGQPAVGLLRPGPCLRRHRPASGYAPAGPAACRAVHPVRLDPAGRRRDRCAGWTWPGGSDAKADGTLATRRRNLAAHAALGRPVGLGPGYGGALRWRAVSPACRGWPAAAPASGQSLRVGSPQADRLLAGDSRLELDLGVKRRRAAGALGPAGEPAAFRHARGEITGDTRRIELEARLANLGLIVPELEGPLTFSGTATQDATGYAVDLTGLWPGQISATVAGRIANGFGSADLQIRGSGAAELANLFIAPRSAIGDHRLRPAAARSADAGLAVRAGDAVGRADRQTRTLACAAGGRGDRQTLQGRSAADAGDVGAVLGRQVRVDGPIQLTGGAHARTWT